MGFKTLVFKLFLDEGNTTMRTRWSPLSFKFFTYFGSVWFERKFYGCWAKNHLLSEKNSLKGLIQCEFHLYSHIHHMWIQENTEIKFVVDSKYALEEESG